MKDNTLIALSIIGVSIFAIVTPLIIAHMSGKNIKGYECGTYFDNNSVSPYCRCFF